MLFETKEIDKTFYRNYLYDFLPERIIDIHTHIWLDRMVEPEAKGDISTKIASWPLRVALDNSIEDLLETYQLVFPGKSVLPLIFSNVFDKDNLEEMNAYAAQSAEKYNLPSLAVTRPDWSGKQFESIIKQGGFLGAKVYLTFSAGNIPVNEICIFDYLPHHQLDILNRHNLIVMLHIPRDKRLRDPLNLKQMIEIENRYPNIKLIIAHVGRAYCSEDVGNAFELLAETENMMFDFSANTNTEVFKKLIDAVGAKRILFGSDMPITRMRMRRICENGTYINIVPKGIYGDVSDDKHMREVESPEADELTLFIYEQIAAFKEAASSTGLTKSDIENVFYNNSRNLLESVKKNITK